MALSTGARRALSEAASWLFLGAAILVSVFYFGEIKSTIQVVLGLPTAPAQGQTGIRQANARPAYSDTTQRISSASSSGRSVELRASAHGQFRARVGINGSNTPVLVDTGASSVALTDRDARRAGLFLTPSDYTVKIQTANGIGYAAWVTIDEITIGDITVNNVRALVNQPGTLHITLLGMSFLNRLRRVDIGSGRMVLEQ